MCNLYFISCMFCDICVHKFVCGTIINGKLCAQPRVFFIQRARVLGPNALCGHHACMHPPLLCKIIWNKKRNSQPDDGNLLFQGARRRAHQHVQILNGCHIINANWKCATLFFNRLCHSGAHLRLYTLYLAAKRWILM